jgi:hypothetical protein
MHGPLEKSKGGEPNIYQNWNMKLLALPLLLAIALIGFAVTHPNVGKWVADGVQAEFSMPDQPRDASSARMAKH